MDAIHPAGVALVAAAGFLPGFLFGFLLRGLRTVKHAAFSSSGPAEAQKAEVELINRAGLLHGLGVVQSVTGCVSDAAEPSAEALEQAELELIKRVGERGVRIADQETE